MKNIRSNIIDSNHRTKRINDPISNQIFKKFETKIGIKNNFVSKQTIALANKNFNNSNLLHINEDLEHNDQMSETR